MNVSSERRPVGTCEFEIGSEAAGRLRLGPLARPIAEAFGAALRKTLMREVEN